MKVLHGLSVQFNGFLTMALLVGGTAALLTTPQSFQKATYASGEGGGCPGPEDDPCPEDAPYCCNDGACHDCPCEEAE